MGIVTTRPDRTTRLQNLRTQVLTNSAVRLAASDKKAVADEIATVAAGIPPDFTDAIATINARLDDAAIP